VVVTPILWLVRHAVTEFTGTRWAGSRSDPPLNDDGWAAAERLAARLARRLGPWTVVCSSPSRRAVQTAEPLAKLLGVEIELDGDLREVDVGAAEGLTFDETAERYPELAKRLLDADRNIDWPDGERADALRARVQGAVGRLEGRLANGPVVIVSHGGVIGEVVAMLAGPEATTKRWLEAGGAMSLERDGRAWRVGERLSPGDP
jgi:broad specificity phosphatase PhoE